MSLKLDELDLLSRSSSYEIIIIKEGWWKAGGYEGDGSVEAAVSGKRNFRFVGKGSGCGKS